MVDSEAEGEAVSEAAWVGVEDFADTPAAAAVFADTPAAGPRSDPPEAATPVEEVMSREERTLHIRTILVQIASIVETSAISTEETSAISIERMSAITSIARTLAIARSTRTTFAHE